MVELAGIIILGILAQWIAWKTKVPAILPLIMVGLLVGPLSTLWTENGQKLIEPIFDPSSGVGLFPGQSLFYFVSLAIGIILFEGGLTLKRREINVVGPSIIRLITIGSFITFVGAGLSAYFIMDLSLSIAFLFGGLIIVTGPTVIAPILQNLPLNRNVATVLKWEGILIDPIGALVAVLVFEFIASGEGSLEFSSTAFTSFIKILLTGGALGFASAYGLYLLIKNELVPHYLLNVFTLALVLFVFVLSDLMAHESGLLTVVVMGMVLGNLDVPRLKEILSFKESLSVLLISILFILLAANIDMSDLQLVFNINCLVLFLVVIFILRPLGVFMSTRNSEITTPEKLFISWVGPRGIVAAGVASLFGIKLSQQGVPGAEYITPLVFMIVMGTVLLNATTARFVARWLNVIQTDSNGILIIGANMAARIIGKYLQENNRHVVLVDNNETSVNIAQQDGMEAFQANIYTDDLRDQFELVDMGYLIAMTSSPEVNGYAVRKYQSIFGELGAFRLITPAEMTQDKADLPDVGIFSYTDDFLNINEVVRDYPKIQEIEIKNKSQLKKCVERLAKEPKSIPLFFKEPDGYLEILTPNLKKFQVEEGCKLVYLGKEVKNLDFSNPA
ncbi:MAG: sodium:proton antiporter [Saprospiraceae bacterium]|nr:sodium:proton antiporter [Saprospiraceae bacterium]